MCTTHILAIALLTVGGGGGGGVFIYLFVYVCMYYVCMYTTRIPEMLGRFLNLNKMKTKRISNHMSQYFIHNRT